MWGSCRLGAMWRLCALRRPAATRTRIIELQRDALIGDLVETYTDTVLPKFGRRRANLYFWSQTLRSIPPLTWARLVKLTTAGGVIEWIRRSIG